MGAAPELAVADTRCRVTPGPVAYLVSYQRGRIRILGTFVHVCTNEAHFDLRKDRIDSHAFTRYK